MHKFISIQHYVFLISADTSEEEEIVEATTASVSENEPNRARDVKSFKCEICNKLYRHKRSLWRHTRLHNAEYQCKTCGKVFSTEEESALHKKERHSKEATKSYLCSMCGKGYTRKLSLEHHSAQHDGCLLKCPIDACQRYFISEKLLSDHLNTHYHAKPYSCKHCNKRFAQKNSLYSHSITCVSGVRCKQCGATFSSRPMLIDHVDTTHSNKSFVCKCGKTFRWRTSLSRHKSKCDHRTQNDF